MKKLLLALCILLAMACNTDKKTSSSQADADQGAAPAPSKGMTLNGLSYEQADEMIRAFLKDRKSSHPTTAIRFDKLFIDYVVDLINQKKIDGVRFYFAKKDGKNTLIPIATVAGTSAVTGKEIHTDFFNITLPTTNADNNMSSKEEHEPTTDIYNTLGVCLHGNCPPTESSVRCKDVRKWANSFKDAHTSEPNIINVTSVWYGENFFQRLAQKMDGAKADGKEPSGIRIYYIRNELGTDGLVFYTTNKSGSDDKDDHKCYKIDERYQIKKRDRDVADDRGEECPVFCPGTTWNDCEP